MCSFFLKEKKGKVLIYENRASTVLSVPIFCLSGRRKNKGVRWLILRWNVLITTSNRALKKQLESCSRIPLLSGPSAELEGWGWQKGQFIQPKNQNKDLQAVMGLKAGGRGYTTSTVLYNNSSLYEN